MLTQDSYQKVVTTFNGRLVVRTDGNETEVRVVKCFPWTGAGQYFSLVDEKGDERLLVESVSSLDAGDAESRVHFERALAEAGFVFEIEEVSKIEEEFQLRCWEVKTRQGPRKLQTLLDDWPTSLPGGGLLIKDIAGDLFHIPDPERLDETSHKIIWPYIK